MLYKIYTTKEAAIVFKKSEATIKRICKNAWEKGNHDINIGSKKEPIYMDITKFGSSWMLISGDTSDVIKIKDARASAVIEVFLTEK